MMADKTSACPQHLRKLAEIGGKRPAETGHLGLIASDKTVLWERGEGSGLRGLTRSEQLGLTQETVRSLRVSTASG